MSEILSVLRECVAVALCVGAVALILTASFVVFDTIHIIRGRK